MAPPNTSTAAKTMNPIVVLRVSESSRKSGTTSPPDDPGAGAGAVTIGAPSDTIGAAAGAATGPGARSGGGAGGADAGSRAGFGAAAGAAGAPDGGALGELRKASPNRGFTRSPVAGLEALTAGVSGGGWLETGGS